MGTRSHIGVMHGDVCKSVYCHWDGYLEHNGRILLDHYDSAKANRLVKFGDMSVLKPEIVIPEGVEHSFDSPAQDITVFYGRDRGEDGIDFQVDHTFKDFIERCNDCDAAYFYLMKDDVWYTGTTDSNILVRLDEALAAVTVKE